MSNFKTLDDIDVSGKTVLVRADLNVPMAHGKVTDPTRLERLAPTLRELMARGARVVVMSHFGRPKGKVVPELSLRPVRDALSEVLGAREIAFAEDSIGPAAADVVAALPEGGIALLENLRFHPGEEANDAEFAAGLAALGSIYVNDAFSAAHRAHASTEALARLLPAAAGRLMQAELEALTRCLEHPERPLVAVIGGVKISTKLTVLEHLITKVDLLVIGGAMANTFLSALGKPIGRSVSETDLVDTAGRIMELARKRGSEIMLPTDAVVAAEPAPGLPSQVVSVDAIPEDQMALDIGPASVARLEQRLEDCRSLVWNGPLGAFEVPPFDAGTTAVARAAAALTRDGRLMTVAGGGDTVAALAHAGVVDDFTYVSTAGGAFLEWLEGKELPGVAALMGGS